MKNESNTLPNENQVTLSTIQNQGFRMSTVEIAKLTGKRHGHDCYRFVLESAEYFLNKCWHLSCRADAVKLREEFRKVDSLFDTFTWIQNTISTEISRAILLSQNTEKDIQEYFIANIDKYIPCGNIVNIKTNGKHIPDFFVETNEMLCVGEIKKDSFDEQAKRQLQRYIKFYKSSHGFAVAKELNSNLDKNMTFIEISEKDVNAWKTSDYH